MKKGYIFCIILAAMMFLLGHTAFAKNDYKLDNIIATETDANEKITSLVENVQVEYNNIALMSEDSTQNIVTVTFDLTNTSSRAANFNVYAAAYKEEGSLYSANVEKRILQSGEKQQLLFSVKVPNDGKNTYGKIFVWDDGMQPTNEPIPFALVNENPDLDMLPNIILSENTKLYSDMYYNNVSLTGGKIDLNGHKLYIKGDLIQSNGEMLINNGELIVNGDYRIQKASTDSYGDTVYGSSNGKLNMTNENDRVLINGDFYMQAYDHSAYLQNGVFELKGNFTQIGYTTNEQRCNFNASKNHKVVLSGTKEQNIYFNSTASGFNQVEFKNENIKINSDMRGWKMTTDLTVQSSLMNISFDGLDLNGYKLHIKGDYIQDDGQININGGSLIIDGDYRIQTASTDSYGDTVYGTSYGKLNMTNENDRVLINGDFYMQAYDHSAYLQNGVFELKGNFTQIGYTTNEQRCNFNASKNHKVVLSGTKEQNIYFNSTASGFNQVEFKNENIKINSDMRGWKMTTDLTVQNDLVNVSFNGLDLNGYKLHIKGDYIQNSGQININGGSLIIDGDYRIQTASTNSYGDRVYSQGYGVLNMTNENDRVLINGNFCTQSISGHSAYLQDGVFELKGDFTQMTGSGTGSYATSQNFDASKNHKVVFSGTKTQNIHFDSTSSGFNIAEFKNENIKINSDMRGWKMTTDLTVQSSLVNISFNQLDLNGYKLHIKGDYIQDSGQININGGSLIIDGDYRIQTASTNSYGDRVYSQGYGVLNMTNENDRVLINGNFCTQSISGHSAYLRDGVFELKGDFTQMTGSGTGSYATSQNFDASKNHKVVLSGTGNQNISFASTSSQFNILILTKPYETGYIFNREPCWNEIYQADAVSINYGGQSGAYAPTGNYSQEFTDMTLLSATGDVPIKRTYNSQDETSSVFNQGWTLSISAKLTDEGNGYKQIKLPDGSTCTFKEENGVYKAQDSRHTLTKNEDGYILTSKSQVKYIFLSDGKIQSMTDRYGNTTRFETDGNGNLTAMIDPSGKRCSFSYNNGKLTSIRDESAGTTVTYEYNSDRLSKAVSPSGVCTYYEYDGNGRLNKILDHDRNLINEIAYNNDNKVSYIIDEYGNKSTYAYDMAEGKTTITDSNGKQKIQWYDSTFNVTKNQDAEGGITATEYNMTDGMNRYNEQRSVTDRNGRNTYYERDSRGNVTRQSNPDGSYKLYTYDEFNNIISERDENGSYTYYVYDVSGTKLLRQAKPLDGVTEYSLSANQDDFAVTAYEYYDSEYSIKGLIKSKTEPEGLVTEFTYYDNGLLKTSTVKDSKDGTSGTTEYHYNAMGLVDYEISPDGYKTTYEYDKAGNLTKLTANNGNAVSIVEYDAAGRKIKEISPNEYAKSGNNSVGQTYSYYPSGKVQSETDALGNTTSYNYDIYGNLTNRINPDGSEYKYTYDGIARKTKEYFKDKNSSDFVLTNEYAYSVDSGKNSQTTETVWLNDTDSITTVNTLDYKENLIEQLRADGTSITKSYDGKGNIKSETDAKGNTKDYAYDAFGNLIQEKIPFDSNYQYKKYTYDKAGNRLSEKITNQSSGSAEQYSLTEYGYNSRGMLISTAGYDNGVIKSAAQYVYDNAGNKVRVYIGLSSLLTINGIDDITENGDSDYAVRKYEYDYNGNMIKAVDALGNEETYAYDGNGNRISYTDRNGNTAVYEYDNMNRLIKKSSGNSSYSYTFDRMGNKAAVSGDYNAQYEYDGKSNLLSETTDNYSKTYTYDLQGNTTSFSLNYNGEEKSNLQYSYDSMGRLASVSDGESEIASYTYDENGNRTSIAYDNGITTNYEFNKANLITSVRDNNNEYSYDYYMNGKQKSKTENGVVENYEYDDLGRLTRAGDISYEYDDYSNRIGDYSYDKNGRIAGYTYDDNGNLLSDKEHTYTYDSWNRLVSADGENYVYDDMNGRVVSGDNSIANDGIHIVYVTDGTNEQIYKNGASPVYSILNEEKTYFSYNGHGDVVRLIDTSGNTVKTYSYDVFGNEKNISENDENPLRYAGQYYDKSSDNYYINSRYYNADMGRFLSQDSFYGNDDDILSLNQYTYCYNDPIQYIDLSGNSVVTTVKSIVTDSLTKAGKDTIKGFLKDQYASAIGCEPESDNYFGTFLIKSGKNVLKNSGSKTAKKLGLSTEYSVFEPVIESGIKNITEEFNASQKENRDFNAGNVVGNTASGVVLSYIKSAPGVGTVYDMCLDLSNGDIFKNLTVKTFTKAVDVAASNMGYEPINWNAGKDIYKVDNKQFTSDYNSFKKKGWSSNTSYWYALTQSYSRKVQRGNSWLKKNRYIK